MIKAIIFDLYETLITEWADGKKKAIYSTDELGMVPSIFKTEWDKRREHRMDGTFPNHQSVLYDILNSQEISINEEAINKVHEGRVKAKSVPFDEMHPEIISMLKNLKSKNIQLGLISNCAPEEVYAWKTCELPSFFETVIFSYDVKMAKPNPEIYLLACHKLGIKPSEALFIGDGGSNELQGATEAGLKAYQAAWFLPGYIHVNNKVFPKLMEPEELTNLVLSVETI